ncbi:glycosyltransferase 87 family protein [Curtobacterium sp. Leaf261]|uniref:glycosyltransferase 87 family protein n=1 Tax=Curtobacterium sp. Leaf261 TaxID=1736311 RepID=UPI0006FA38A2|nr:glycosyltransferase 87 family protein [Curtobacterium sp. Leaf261]KQO65229.1 hypothetical protein ASF23_00015 [Curtobacterium sp. Leaf261]
MTRNGTARDIERAGLVLAFAAVHALLWWTGTTGPNLPFGDVTIAYRQWMDQGGLSGGWVGIDKPWVYPVVALVPMLLASVGGTGSIELGWLVMVTVLDGIVLALLWRQRVGRVRVAWWWTVFLLALGPIALGRIDTVATAVALAGVVWIARRPAVASALFTVAAWIKVWPAALVGVLLLLRRGLRTRVLLGAAIVTAVVVLLDLLVGGGAHLLSFVGQQTGRGLQIEAPLATPFLWRASAGVHGTFVYYDAQILTFQVAGAGTSIASAISTQLMALVVLVGALLALWAAASGARRTELAPVLALLFVGALIATNKVGSPQYIGWLAVPVVWGLLAGRRSARRFALPAVLALVTAFATQLIYPDYYDRVLALQPLLLGVLTVRNALEVVLLVWSVVALVRMGRAARIAAAHGREARPAPAVQA